MENKVYISCVIPVYNNENCIEQTLLSVINQTLKEIEIIVVDDASCDNTLQIIEKYANLDNRITVLVNAKNLGCSSSRNKAFEIAKGEYVHFMDSDDLIDKNSYKILYERALNNKSDIIIFDYYKLYNKNKRPKKKNLNNKKIYSTIEDKKLLLRSGVTVWNKIYRTGFLKENRLFFLAYTFYEDVPFFWQNIVLANNIEYEDKFLYYYVQRCNSIMSSQMTAKKIRDLLFVFVFIRIFLKNNKAFDDFEELLTIRFIKSIFSFYGKLKQDRRIVFNEIAERVQWVDSNIIRKKSKLKYLRFYLMKKKQYVLYRIFFKWF